MLLKRVFCMSVFFLNSTAKNLKIQEKNELKSNNNILIITVAGMLGIGLIVTSYYNK